MQQQPVMSVPEVLPSGREPRAKGIFYSPEDLALEMVSWAVRRPTDSVFDPSFGGCVFLRSAVARLLRLGSKAPESQVAGVDVDDGAWTAARELIRAGSSRRHFRTADFLAVEPADVGGPFVAVVGNPPYVRHHVLSAAAVQTAQKAMQCSGYAIPATASYWAYFVLHAIKFVSSGGRLSMILPGAFLYADYAAEVRMALRQAFDELTVVLVDSRVFSGVEEQSVLVLADRRGGARGLVRVGRAVRARIDLSEAVLLNATRRLSIDEADGSWLRGTIDASILAIYDELASRCARLGTLAQVRIGAVTGAKRFFVLTNRDAEDRGIELTCLSPVVARAAQLRGLVLRAIDRCGSRKGGGQLYLFSPPATGPCPPGARAYIRWGEAQGFQKSYKCSKRSPWYALGEHDPPDAFLAGMAATSPRLVLNKARMPCTNTIYELHWRQPFAAKSKQVALAMVSSLAQLSAEIEGRSYGGGVLKIEPSDASRLALPVDGLGADSAFAAVDRLCQAGRWGEATAIVDRALSRRLVSRRDLRLVADALVGFRERRMMLRGVAVAPLFESDVQESHTAAKAED